jgi:hypothetical protein
MAHLFRWDEFKTNLIVLLGWNDFGLVDGCGLGQGLLASLFFLAGLAFIWLDMGDGIGQDKNLKSRKQKAEIFTGGLGMDKSKSRK